SHTLRAGPFVVPVPPETRVATAQSIVAGVRPEDLVLESGGAGVPVQVATDIDLGHYRRVTLEAEGVSLLAFAPKTLGAVPATDARVRPSRVLIYADGPLAGVSELAVDRTAEAEPVVVRPRSVPSTGLPTQAAAQYRSDR